MGLDTGHSADSSIFFLLTFASQISGSSVRMIDSDLFYVAQFEIFHSFSLPYKELRVFRSGAMSLGKKINKIDRRVLKRVF